MNRRSRIWEIACIAVFVLCLVLTGLLWNARRSALLQTTSASYTPLSGEAEWEGDWKLAERGADPSEVGSLAGSDRITIPFSGKKQQPARTATGQSESKAGQCHAQEIP